MLEMSTVACQSQYNGHRCCGFSLVLLMIGVSGTCKIEVKFFNITQFYWCIKYFYEICTISLEQRVFDGLIRLPVVSLTSWLYSRSWASVSLPRVLHVQYKIPRITFHVFMTFRVFASCCFFCASVHYLYINLFLHIETCPFDRFDRCSAIQLGIRYEAGRIGRFMDRTKLATNKF